MAATEVPIVERGISEANLLRRLRLNHTTAKRMTTLRLFGPDRTLPTSEDTVQLQILLAMAKEFETLDEQRLRVQMLGAMAGLASSLDSGDQKMFEQVLKAVVAKDKRQGDDEPSEAELLKMSSDGL